MLVALAIAGLVAGVAGLSVAVVAHNRVNQVVEECAEVLRRRLQVAGPGSVDAQALRDLAIVHYDALKEMSGHRSFSLALINAVGDGVVISSIIGRTETRTYAKVVRDGHPTEPLSPEENQALRAARLGKGPIVSMDDPLPDFGAAARPPRPRLSEPSSATD
ncbi:DUF4446 family protein [Actinomadura rupiterrae]|uniref:DUF4446 family protein n=1 Tax=Actinomadura rupiterrae TaxID=559627 RepID=UPI0020A2DBAB|nr:DUF4446 family protein [Actinomadura rupiterrae]